MIARPIERVNFYGIGASSVIVDGTCLGLRVASEYTPTPIRPKKPHTSTAITWLRPRLSAMRFAA
jgi:hypothetical protein